VSGCVTVAMERGQTESMVESGKRLQSEKESKKRRVCDMKSWDW
jgi:hypothetical protein